MIAPILKLIDKISGRWCRAVTGRDGLGSYLSQILMQIVSSVLVACKLRDLE